MSSTSSNSSPFLMKNLFDMANPFSKPKQPAMVFIWKILQSIFWKRPQKSLEWKPSGLENLGNTCFLNSVLQAFASTPSLTQYLDDKYFTEVAMKGSLTYNMQTCIKALRQSPSQYDTRVKSIYHLLAKHKKNLGDRDQQDAEECLQALLAILSKDRERRRRKELQSFSELMIADHAYPPALPFEGLLQSTITCTGCNMQRTVKHDAFVDISLPMVPPSELPSQMSQSFSGFSGSGSASLRNPMMNSFSCLSASKSNAITLSDCLHRFSQDELLEDVECTQCTYREYVRTLKEAIEFFPTGEKYAKDAIAMKKRLRDLIESEGVISKIEEEIKDEPRVRCSALKQLQISRLPQVLCFHLSRRTICPRTGRMLKIKDRVEFPALLDMTRDAGSSCASSPCSRIASDDASLGTYSPPLPPSPLPRFNLDREGGSCKYALRAVIEHSGGPESGHYTTYALVDIKPSAEAIEGDNQDAQTASRVEAGSKWMHFSDEHVQEVSQQQVLSSEAYILFYDRQK